MRKTYDRIAAITKTDGKDLTQRALKTAEEVGELSEATLSFTNAPGTAYKQLGKQDVIEEACDTIICGFSMISHVAPEMTLDQIAVILNKKMTKWEKKVEHEKYKRLRNEALKALRSRKKKRAKKM